MSDNNNKDTNPANDLFLVTCEQAGLNYVTAPDEQEGDNPPIYYVDFEDLHFRIAPFGPYLHCGLWIYDTSRWETAKFAKLKRIANSLNSIGIANSAGEENDDDTISFLAFRTVLFTKDIPSVSEYLQLMLHWLASAGRMFHDKMKEEGITE